MDFSKGEMADLVRRVLPKAQLEGSAIYWYKRAIPKGESLRTGRRTLTMPFDGYVVFVDLAPGANWAHPCVYILVGIDSLTTQVVDSFFPPSTAQVGDDPVVLQPAAERPEQHHGRLTDS
jgi:hypothetical protein